MPRSPRLHFPDALSHVMARENGGQKIFLDPSDHRTFRNILADVKRQKPFHLYAYCLMPNHFHLLIEVDRFSISLIMNRLMLRYAKRFNIRRKRFGHVFQNRFKSILCQKDSYLLELLRYIHLNPVRAALSSTPSAWPWSSHSAYLRDSLPQLVDAQAILPMFHRGLSRSRQLYSEFVQSAIGRGHEEDFYPSPSKPYLGDEDFISDHHDLAHRRRADHGPKPPPPALSTIAEKHLRGLSIAALRSPSREGGVAFARKSVVLEAVQSGHAPSVIAGFLNRSPSSISKIITQNHTKPSNRTLSELVNLVKPAPCFWHHVFTIDLPAEDT